MTRLIKFFSVLTVAGALLSAGLVLSQHPAHAVSEPEGVLEPSDRHREVSQTVTKLVEKDHYRGVSVDDGLSSRILDRYLEALDSNKMYFLKRDIDGFQVHRNRLDDSVRKGDVQAVFDIFVIYRDRTRERMEYALSLLDSEPDFSEQETYFFDRADGPWSGDEGELNDLWRRRVKNDSLSLILAEKTWDEAREVLEKRYKRVLKRVSQLNSDDVFETFMNAYVRTLDPHSSYFSPRNSEEYRIQMSLSYEGIGASLQVEEDYVTVMDIIAGGPAAVNGELKPDDRITAVGQGADGEMVDVIGWRLDDVVQLIRGPGGTIVRLQILPGAAAPGTDEGELALTRDRIKLEAQAAKEKVIKIPRKSRELTIGVISVPSFYRDYSAKARGDENFTSSTADVRRLIAELEKTGIDGLILDLRNNGGGHLSEATGLSGLFIERGPVVQYRDANRRVQVLADPDPGIAYRGPLAVLVNRYSASASEIVAAAIQDYGRGVVIGQRTFGKGSVQNLYPLDGRNHPLGRLLGSNAELGQLTLTVGKYYRVTGGSTQHKGVDPDIQLPSAINSELVGESTRETALPWDFISVADQFAGHRPLGSAITELAQNHEHRISSDPDFRFFLDDIAAIRDLSAQKSVSLHLETRQEERERIREQQLGRENKRREARGLPRLESTEDLNDLEPLDVVLDEAAEIVADMIKIDTMVYSSPEQRPSLLN